MMAPHAYPDPDGIARVEVGASEGEANRSGMADEMQQRSQFARQRAEACSREARAWTAVADAADNAFALIRDSLMHEKEMQQMTRAAAPQPQPY